MGLKHDFSLGVFYTAIAKYSGIVIQLIITAILSRLLTPADFGVVAIATIIIQFFNTISEAGIGPAIIQKKDLTSTEIGGLFAFTTFLGLFLSIVFFFCSSTIARYYDNEALTNICRCLSILILFSSIDIVTNSLLLKQKRFKTIAIRTLLIQILTGVLSVYVATRGWGMYALVFSAISSKVLIFIINYLCNPIRINFHFGCIKRIASYSTYQFLFNILNYFSRNVDKLIIGKFMGMNQLGYYEKSYRLMMLPLSNITYVFTPVMHPIFSELQNDLDELLEKYLKLLTIIGCISFPLMTFLFFDARELVLIIFGDQWEQSVLPFKILSLTAALQVMHATSSGIFQAINDTRGLFVSSLVSAILLIAGFFVSAIIYKTVVAIAVSFLITCTFGSCIVFYFLFRSFNKNIALLWKVLKTPFTIGATEFLVLGIFHLINPIQNNYATLAINMVLTFIVWVAVLLNTKYPNLKEIKIIFK